MTNRVVERFVTDMYLRFAEPFELSEDELKRQIVWSINDIIDTSPEHFKCDPQTIPTPETVTSVFIARIAEMPALIGRVRANVLMQQDDPLRSLRIIFRFISGLRWAYDVELRLLALISLMNSSQFLGIRYFVATELMKSVLHEEPKYVDIVSESLLNPYSEDNGEVRYACELAAEEEIDRALSDPRTRDRFLEVITAFEDNIEAQIKRAFPDVLTEIAFRLTMEAIVASAGIIDEKIGTSEEFDPKFFSDLIDQIMRQGKKFTNLRVGIKRGGPRSTTKFVWNDDRKREFYEAVTKLVHKNGKRLWEFAYEEVIENDFSHKIIDLLRTETDLKDVPTKLWNDAIKSWKGHSSDFRRLEADKRPEAFAMYHALYLLGFPKTSFLTMKKYFGHGKKLRNAARDT